jgi:hypothetical protein
MKIFKIVSVTARPGYEPGIRIDKNAGPRFARRKKILKLKERILACSMEI